MTVFYKDGELVKIKTEFINIDKIIKTQVDMIKNIYYEFDDYKNDYNDIVVKDLL